MTVYLLIGITFGFAAAIQPGPFQTFLISRTLNDGWRHTLPATCAPLLSDIPVVILVLLLLKDIPVGIENVLHLAGGLFVLYLAHGALQAFKKYQANRLDQVQSKRENFFKAIAVNLLNPNPYLSWSLVMGPLLLKGWRETPGNGIALVGSFYGTMILVSGGIILILTAVKKLGARVNRVLIGVSAVALAFFGFYQIWLGASGLWLK